MLDAISSTPGCHLARLTGSGATCFGVYDNDNAAMAAVNKIKQQYPRWWVAPTQLLK